MGLSFIHFKLIADVCANCHQNRTKIATVRARTERSKIQKMTLVSGDLKLFIPVKYGKIKGVNAINRHWRRRKRNFILLNK